MSCLPELTYAVYVDGELPAQETLHVESHLAACDRCRALVEALRAENRLLAEVLQPAAEPAAVAARPLGPLDILWTTVGVLAAAALLQPALAWLAGLSAPLGADWLNPFSQSGQVGLIFRSVSYFLEEGVGTVISTITTISALVLGLLVLAGGVFLLRRRPSAVAVLATLALALLAAQPAAALERRKGAAVSVPEGETLDDTLLAHAEVVNIDGVLTGNLIAFGQQVTVTGTVQGDVLVCAQNLDIKGTVEGNVFAFAQQVNVGGKVRKNVHAWAGGLLLEPAGHVDGDVFVFTGQATLEGSIGHDVFAFAGSVNVPGNIGRNLTARTDRLTLLGTAQVGGDLNAYLKNARRLQIDPAAIVAGETTTHLRRPGASRYAKPRFYFWQGISLASAFLTGFLLFWLFPSLFATRLETAGAVLKGIGIGFVALVATPIAAIIAGITLVGLPLAVLSLALWVIGLYLAKIFVAAFIGRALTRPDREQPAQFALALLVGLVILHVAFYLPYLGFLIQLLVLVLGLGMSVLQVHRWWPRRPAAQTTAPAGL